MAIIVSLLALNTTLVLAHVLELMQCPAVAIRLGPMSVPARDANAEREIGAVHAGSGWLEWGPRA